MHEDRIEMQDDAIKKAQLSYGNAYVSKIIDYVLAADSSEDACRAVARMIGDGSSVMMMSLKQVIAEHADPTDKAALIRAVEQVVNK